jgi:hypothetical protein
MIKKYKNNNLNYKNNINNFVINGQNKENNSQIKIYKILLIEQQLKIHGIINIKE